MSISEIEIWERFKSYLCQEMGQDFNFILAHSVTYYFTK
jgi:hypothetical protein